MTDFTPFAQQISHDIWDLKYRLKTIDGSVIDHTVLDTWNRVSVSLAAPERSEIRGPISAQFRQALEGFKFMPAGRVIAGTGTGRNVTLFNCYVMGTIPDSMDGIFDMLKEAALTMQQGGGIGYDFSTLRPKGSPVKGVGAEASGPLTFMDVWDSMCRTVMSAGTRRGAMMATMRCDHPDIQEFISVKQDANRLRMFNLSVLCTDEFMRAVDADEEWPLKWKGETQRVVWARALWEQIMRSTYDCAEPGVIFIDRINQRNNLRYCEEISATNPCGEQPLPPYGACLLGSINLPMLVENPFTEDASIDPQKFNTLVRIAVRMLDNVIDVSNFPLRQQREEAEAKRRIGLGVTGLADALAMMETRYGSTEGLNLAHTFFDKVKVSAYEASAELAREKGAFPLYDDRLLEDGTFASTLPTETKEMIREFGLRNSHLLSIAPTGTISLYGGNVSSGIEPIFAHEYTRKVLMEDGSRQEQTVRDYAVHKYLEMHGEDAPLPSYFQTAQDLSPEDHVRMQALAQRHIDSSISKTINVPEGISFDAFRQVYMLAYQQGCKGCTTYRPNEVTGSILEVKDDKKETPDEIFDPIKDSELSPEPLADRPSSIGGMTYKLKMAGEDHALYLTINDDENGAPFEIFLNSKNMEHYSWTIALTRMISAIFRRGGDVGFVADELCQVFDPRGGGWVNGRYMPSILALIGWTLRGHMQSTGYLKSDPGMPEKPEGANVEASASLCAKCGGMTKHEGGCIVCIDCGDSSCG